jgi:hypothetical protein
MKKSIKLGFKKQALFDPDDWYDNPDVTLFIDKEYIVSKTYKIVTPESAEIGEYADSGFLFEKETMTFEEVVNEIETGGYIEASDSRAERAKSPAEMPDSLWLSTEASQDPYSGEWESSSLHIDNAKGEDWFALLKASGWLKNKVSNKKAQREIDALKSLLDFITSGERYDVRNPYLIPVVKEAIRVYEEITGEGYSLGEKESNLSKSGENRQQLREEWEYAQQDLENLIAEFIEYSPLGPDVSPDDDRLYDEIVDFAEHKKERGVRINFEDFYDEVVKELESRKSLGAKKSQAEGEPFTLTFKTSELLDMFDLPDLELDPGDIYLPDIFVAEIRDVAEQYDIPEELWDDPDIESGIYTAISDGYHLGISGAYYKQVKEALENTLETFSNYPYEYFSEEDFESYSGIAKGIIPGSINIGYDNTTFEAYPDLANIVQDNVAGYGQFDVSEDFEGEEPEEYAKSRFHWLAYYWEIYGDRPPQPDLDRLDDFDDKAFEEYMNDVVMPLVREKS